VQALLTTVPGYAELDRIVRADLHLMDLLCTAREINLPQCRVVAGCIYQSVWNVLTGRPRGTGINDYDLIYFDTSDISEGAEKAIERSVQSRLPAFPAPIEVRNQARVHLWFEGYFGIAYPPCDLQTRRLLDTHRRLMPSAYAYCKTINSTFSPHSDWKIPSLW
jgi:hypothetical protein